MPVPGVYGTIDAHELGWPRRRLRAQDRSERDDGAGGERGEQMPSAAVRFGHVDRSCDGACGDMPATRL